MKGTTKSEVALGSAQRIGLLVYCVALTALFVSSLYHLFVYVLGTDLHSHVVLIPVITGYLLSINRGALPHVTRPSFSLAAPLLLGGIVSFVLTHVAWGRSLSENDGLALATFSFLCFIWGGGFLFLGRTWMRAAAFPLAFLIFMVPLPDGVANALETASKYASAEATAVLLHLFGIPHFRQGLIFRLPGIAIEVAQECSGIRSSWVLFITSLLASHLFLRSSWRRALLVAFVIPLGVIRNGFRIAVISWLCVKYGPEMINSPVHRRGGPYFFVLSLVPLFALLWWLRHSEEKKHRERATLPAGVDPARP